MLLPWIRIQNLASTTLALALRRLPADWRPQCGVPPPPGETLVDPPRDTAGGWVQPFGRLSPLAVGQTPYRPCSPSWRAVTRTPSPLRRAGMSVTTIQPTHCDRLAYVYVRQSTPGQVLENRESTERQYHLQARAVALGWAPSRVEIIDEDQGRAGGTAAHRTGFQRLVSEG